MKNVKCATLLKITILDTFTDGINGITLLDYMLYDYSLHFP